MEPYLDNPPVVDDEKTRAARAQLNASLEKTRQEEKLKRTLMAPHLLQLLKDGPELHNLDKAAECLCACHPRPADPTLHDGGSTCSCQLTQEERHANFEKFMHVLTDIRKDTPSKEEENLVLAQKVAKQLDASIISYGGAAPFVIIGSVDGRNFYLRERHEEWRLVLAGEQNPTADVWRDRPEDALVIDEGTENTLGNPYQEVQSVVTMVIGIIRTYLLEIKCQHTLGGNFCPTCGVALSDRYFPRR